MLEESIEPVILKLLKLEASTVFDGHALASLSIDNYYDYLLQGLVYKVRTMVPAESMKKETHTVTVKYPDGWWNAFKAQYFPDWALKTFPVKYVTKSETVIFTAYMLYPKFPKVLRGDNEVQWIMKDIKVT